MKVKNILSLFIIFLIFFGCVSFPEPTPTHDTLVVGKFRVNFNNIIYDFGIWIYFHDQSGNLIQVSSQNDGWFFTNRLTGGEYTIQRIHCSGYGYALNINGPFPITIEAGKVNNLGNINIKSETIAPRTASVLVESLNYDSSKNEFHNKFPKTKWNDYEWNRVFWLTRHDRSNLTETQDSLDSASGIAEEEELIEARIVTVANNESQENLHDNNQIIKRRIVWGGGENAFFFNVVIEKEESNNYSDYLSEFTTLNYLEVSLPSGKYRFRIIPYDILDRPYEAGATRWINIEIP